MNLTQDDLKKIYLKYLFTAFGSAIVLSIYSTVDLICVGHYDGPLGAAALSVVTPIWAFTVGIGILIGLGGAVMTSVCRGKGDERDANEYFTVSMIITVAVTIILTAFYCIYRKEILIFFGADETVLPYAMTYTKWLFLGFPFYIIVQPLILFLRNDNAPTLAAISVLGGGVLNIVGDIYLVFFRDMGLEGAGLATALGELLSALIMSTHFLSKKCTLKFVRPHRIINKSLKTLSSGLSPSFDCVAPGVILIAFNNVIAANLGQDSLAIYGIAANLFSMSYSLFSGIGQAIQPISSENFGAGLAQRVKTTLYYGIVSGAATATVVLVLTQIFPHTILRIYMNAPDDVIETGAGILRIFCISLVFMGLSTVICYYLQSTLNTNKAFIVSFSRSLLLPAIFLAVLPNVVGYDIIWWIIPISEAVAFVLGMFFTAANLQKISISVIPGKKTISS